MNPLEPFVDRLVPNTLNDSVEEYYRARILIMVCLSTVAVLLPFCIARYAIQGIHPYPLILTFITLLNASGLFFLRRTGSIRQTGIYLTLPGTFAFAFLCIVDGGLDSPTLVALPILPLLGIFFAGFRLGLFLFFINTVALLALIAFPDASWIQPNPFEGDVRDYFWASSAVASSLVLIAMAYFFVHWQQLLQERLLAVNKAKDEFLSGMSHEIRTPLNSILGFADALDQGLSGELNEKQSKYVSNILSSSEHLSTLVDDFLDITAIEENKVELSLVNFNLKEVLEDCVASMNNAHENQIIFSIKKPTTTISADETRIRQIVLNLLSNAQKFTPKGQPVLLNVDTSDSNAIISVQDHGPGIPEENQQDIFDKFFQGNISLAGKIQGSGLGLFISKRLCELHGGELNLDQSYTDGARFVFTLPLVSD